MARAGIGAPFLLKLGLLALTSFLGCADQESARNTNGERHTTTTSAAMRSRAHEAGDRNSFYLRAADQRSDGTTVVVEEAVLTGTSGWVVVHAQERGSPGPVIGHSRQLQAGTSRQVIVTLSDPPIASRATVYLMLHTEGNGNQEFDFPRADQAASASDGNVVMVPITMEIG